jgi:hypothetical protein
MSLSREEFANFMRLMKTTYGTQWTKKFEDPKDAEMYYKMLCQNNVTFDTLFKVINKTIADGIAKGQKVFYPPNLPELLSACRNLLGHGLPSESECFHELYNFLLGKYWENRGLAHPITVYALRKKGSSYWEHATEFESRKMFSEMYAEAVKELLQTGKVTLVLAKGDIPNFPFVKYPKEMYNLIAKEYQGVYAIGNTTYAIGQETTSWKKISYHSNKT